MDSAAVGYLKTKIFLREVLLQDLPFIELECPTHPVFNATVFRKHADTWQRWKATMLDFHCRMKKIESTFFCPSLPIVGSNPGMQLQIVAKWIQQATEDVLITHAFQVRVCFSNSFFVLDVFILFMSDVCNFIT